MTDVREPYSIPAAGRMQHWLEKGMGWLEKGVTWAGTSCVCFSGSCCTQESSLLPAASSWESRHGRADHGCRGSFAVPRTRSQTAAGSRAQENLGSELEEAGDASGKGGGRMFSWHRGRDCAQGRAAVGVRDGNADVLPALLPRPCQQHPLGLSVALPRTQGPKGFSQNALILLVSLPTRANTNGLMPGHSLSGPFPVPRPRPRIWPEAQPHSFTRRSVGRFLVGTVTVHFTLVCSGLLCS